MVQSAHPIRVPRHILLVLALATLTVNLTAQVRTINLHEMVESSGLVFVGSVAETRTGLDEHGELATWTTFRVEMPIGIMPLSMVTVKQLGGTADGRSHYLTHMRYFQRSERVLVMFYPTSSLGFTSPIGLDQAVWPVSNDGRVLGVRGTTLSGLGDLGRHGIAQHELQDIELSRFSSLLSDLLHGRKTR